jgi:hypothetical protein
MTIIIEALRWGVAAFSAWLLAFIIPITPFLIFTIVLVLSDLYTGTKAALHRKETLHSRGFRRSIEKIVLYFLGILLSKGLEDTFGLQFHLPYVVAGLIALTEFKSNIENISQVTGVDLWTNIVQKLPSLSDFMKKKNADDGKEE